MGVDSGPALVDVQLLDDFWQYFSLDAITKPKTTTARWCEQKLKEELQELWLQKLQGNLSAEEEAQQQRPEPSPQQQVEPLGVPEERNIPGETLTTPSLHRTGRNHSPHSSLGILIDRSKERLKRRRKKKRKMLI